MKAIEKKQRTTTVTKRNEFAAQEYLKRPYVRSVVPESDGTFRAEIMEFPGCLAIGDTAAQALAKLEDVAESWLESVIARKQQVPSPMEEIAYSGKFVTRLPKSLHRKAALAAARDSVSLNTFVVDSIAQAVGVRSSTNAVALAGTANFANVFVQVGNFQVVNGVVFGASAGNQLALTAIAGARSGLTELVPVPGAGYSNARS
jgi:predicted HicB family RNase H-like nuclease